MMGFSQGSRDIFVAGSVVCLLGASLAGCALDAQSGDGVAEDFGSASSAVVPDGPFNFGEVNVAHSGPLTLTDTRGDYFAGACFLMSLRGRFEGGGEWIQVMKQGPGVFELSRSSGQGGQTGPYGSAACVGNAIGYRGSWRIGDSKLPLRRGGTCFLTRVEGKFRGGGEWVGLWQEGDQWYLGGDTKQDATVAASAGCVSAPQLLRVETEGADWDARLTKKAHTACFLQVVRGVFQGVEQGLNVSTNSSTGYWHLSAPSAGAYIHGAAGCIDASHTELTP